MGKITGCEKIDLEEAIKKLNDKFKYGIGSGDNEAVQQKPPPKNEVQITGADDVHIALEEADQFLKSAQQDIKSARAHYFNVKNDREKSDAALSIIVEIVQNAQRHLGTLKKNGYAVQLLRLDKKKFNQTVTDLEEVLGIKNSKGFWWRVKLWKLLKRVEDVTRREELFQIFFEIERQKRGVTKVFLPMNETYQKQTVVFDGLFLVPSHEKTGKYKGEILSSNILLFGKISEKIADFHRSAPYFQKNLGAFCQKGVYEIKLPQDKHEKEGSVFVSIEEVTKKKKYLIVRLLFATGSSVPYFQRYSGIFFNRSNLYDTRQMVKFNRATNQVILELKKLIRKCITMANKKKG